jgi:hypothetical protein
MAYVGFCASRKEGSMNRAVCEEKMERCRMSAGNILEVKSRVGRRRCWAAADEQLRST